MYKQARIQKIQEILRDKQEIEVGALSKLLGVSDATIRSDLILLEKENFLTRYHGGAVINHSEQTAPSTTHIFEPQNEDKSDVGLASLQIINNHDSIFLGPGTTTYYIALAIRQKTDFRINVVTNNFLVASALQACSHIPVYFVGGRISPDGLYTIPEALDSLFSKINLDKFFFSIDGIDLEAGYTLSDTYVHELILTLANHAQKTIVAADISKFDNRSFMTIGDLTFAQTIVTNRFIPERYYNYFRDHDIPVVTAIGISSL